MSRKAQNPIDPFNLFSGAAPGSAPLTQNRPVSQDHLDQRRFDDNEEEPKRVQGRQASRPQPSQIQASHASQVGTAPRLNSPMRNSRSSGDLYYIENGQSPYPYESDARPSSVVQQQPLRRPKSEISVHSSVSTYEQRANSRLYSKQGSVIQQSRAPSEIVPNSIRQKSIDQFSTISGVTRPKTNRDDLESVRSTRSRRTVATIDPLASSVRDAQLPLDPIEEWDNFKEPGAPEPRRIHLRQHLGLGITELVLSLLVFIFAIVSLARPPRGDMLLLATGVWLGPCLAVVAIMCIFIRIKNTYKWAAVCFYALCVAAPLSVVGIVIECIEVAFVDTRYKMLREEWDKNQMNVCVSCTEFSLAKSGIIIFFLFVEAILFSVSALLAQKDAGLSCCKLAMLDEPTVKTVYVAQPVYIEVPEGTISRHDANSVMTAPSFANHSMHSMHSMHSIHSMQSAPPSRGPMSMVSDKSGRGGRPRSLTDLLNEKQQPM